MSEINRSSRRTSCCMTAISRSREWSAWTRGRVSSALRSDVNGFFSSCATSAAKLSIASRRLYSAMVISRSAPRQVPDLVGPGGEVGDLLARPYAAPHPLSGRREPPHRLGDRVGKRQREHQHDGGQDDEEAEDRPAFRGDHAIDVAPLRRKLERAARRHHVLDWNRDRYDRFAFVVDPDGDFRLSVQRRFDLGHRHSVDEPRFSGRAPKGCKKVADNAGEPVEKRRAARRNRADRTAPPTPCAERDRESRSSRPSLS